MPSSARRPRSGARSTVELDVRSNSLNLVRLVLAAVVLVSHSFPLGGFGAEPGVADHTLGTWAVYGFFAVSGYLITASRFSHRLAPYLLKRVARLFPAFLTCNLVTAIVVAPAAWLLQGRSVADLFTGRHSPLDYVLQNAGLWMRFYDIGGGPVGVPRPGAWNGSLWSLYYEFCCYLAVGVLALWPATRRPAVMAAGFAISVAAWMVVDATHVANMGSRLASLLPVFLGGALLQTLARRGLRFTWPGALVAVLLASGLVAWGGGAGPQLAAPLIGYVLLWVSTVLPSPVLVQRHDVSYGCYIYAFPIQQLLAVLGVHRDGFVVYLVSAGAVTVGAAVLSWRYVESPFVRLAARLPRLARPGVTQPVRLHLPHAPTHLAPGLTLPVATPVPAVDDHGRTTQRVS